MTPAAWIAQQLHPFAHDVGSVVPTGFAAYARIPNIDNRQELLGDAKTTELTGLLARHSSQPDACWFCVWDGYGYFHAGAVKQLVAVSSSLPAWRRWWERRRVMRRARPGEIKGPRVPLPNRDYFLFTGSVAEAVGWLEGPNLWWPDDRAWCVASEIDLPHSYVGGSSGLISDILGSRRIGATPASLDDALA